MQSPGYSPYPRQNAAPPQLRIEVIGEAFQFFKAAPGVYMVSAIPALLATAANLVISFSQQMALKAQNRNDLDLGPLLSYLMVASVVAIFASVILYMSVGGATNAALKQIRGGTPTFSDTFSFSGGGLNAFGALVLGAIVSLVAYCFCFVPGLIVAGLFALMFPLAIEEKLGPVAILQRSWDLLKPHMFLATCMIFILKMMLSLSIYLCGVGLLVALPVYGITTALIYRDLVLIPMMPTPQISAAPPTAGPIGYEYPKSPSAE